MSCLDRSTQHVNAAAGAEKREMLQPLSLLSPSLFMTSSPQGGPVQKGNLAQFHRDVPWKGLPLLRHQLGHRKARK